ncbi:alpha/beta fold hydrolase [Marinomonas sp. C2222]|uniref:Alpha/beta fold hydrolase n=1 Tax=Marinomonas sargassi TaxID=2984494 RepID=A0ABT2YVS9_9GAMM|nr:alpha/beta fold hydrolase [Marinomonas sargassi]MCV2404007.1 alpha/beta fold hydrolase [Marinomonas sargassi]
MFKAIVSLAFFFFMHTAAASESPRPFVFLEGEIFHQYQQRASVYLKTNKLWVNEEDQARELAAVMPFELIPGSSQCEDQQSIGILLSHGLSDSPFSMRSIASALQAACYYVRVLLLPGHGTKAEDLLEVSRDDWRDTFRYAAKDFKSEVDILYVGGFSTGGALATEYAWNHPDDVSGVLLLSPIFKINSGIDWLAPWLSLVKDWLDHEATDDFAKYASIPLPAIAEVYRLSKEVRNLVLGGPKSLPVFIALSEDDQTVDSAVTQQVFQEGMLSENSRMLLYSLGGGNTGDRRVTQYHSSWPERKILGMSHMAVHGSPDNPYYGADGEYRVCGWHISDKTLYEACRSDLDNWFGERSDILLEKSAHAARLSWNPHFSELVQSIDFFLQSNAQ